MKTLKNQIKLSAVILAQLVVFQGCIAFKSNSVTLEQAAIENIKTKIKTDKGKNIKFKFISYENGKYFGVNKKNGEIVRTILNKEEIRKIRLKDKTMSIVLNSLLGLTVIAIAPAVVFAAGGGV